MIEKINEQDLSIFETLSNPISATEIVFSNLGNLAEFDTEKYSKVRKYQFHFFSWDTQFIDNSELSAQENWKIKNGFSEAYILGGRLTGKSLIGLIVDVLFAILHGTFRRGSVSSADAEKIKKVMEQIFVALEYHPFFKLLKVKTKRSPNYSAMLPNGIAIDSVNNNIAGKSPGSNWHGRHDDKNWEEESSYLSNTVTHEKLMAQAEAGCINHQTGMTDFDKESPMGRIFDDLTKKSKIVNLPSYVNPTWSKEKDEDALREFGGYSSPGYSVQILGNIVEGGETVYLMEKIRDTYLRDKDDIGLPIKHFEINKDNIHRFKEFLILDRPNNVESEWIALDVGEGGAPTEIIVLHKINGVYKYEYNVTTYKITPDENEMIIRFMIEQLKPNVVALDHSSGGGKYLLSSLIKTYPNNIFGVDFNSKIDVDFETDEQGNQIYVNGIVKYKQEYIVDWSIQRLKNIFYNRKISCLFDLKLDDQFSKMKVMKSGQRTIYKNKSGVDHLHQAFQVFAIADWNLEFKNLQPANRRKTSLGAG
jgi:hypothetical protein